MVGVVSCIDSIEGHSARSRACQYRFEDSEKAEAKEAKTSASKKQKELVRSREEH